MTWGTDIRMLGRVGPSSLASASTSTPIQLPPRPLTPADALQLAGSYAGAWVGGGVLGLVLDPTLHTAFRGGLAASGIRNLVDAATSIRSYPVWLLSLLGLTGGLSVWWAWHMGRGQGRSRGLKGGR